MDRSNDTLHLYLKAAGRAIAECIEAEKHDADEEEACDNCIENATAYYAEEIASFAEYLADSREDR